MRNIDFGGVAAPSRRGQGVLIGLCAVGIATFAVAPKLASERTAAIAEARAWTINGPPCPRLTPAEASRWPYQPDDRKSFGYAGANFGFAYGHVACAQIHDDGGRAMFRGYPVCQFTSPAVVAVHVGKTTVFFTPGLSKRATVSVRNGVATCVMAGRFYGQNNF